MKSSQLSVAAVVAATILVWLVVLSWRWRYLPQIPLYDMDVTTAAANMWTRNWWVEGPLKLWLALPYSPRSVEAPTLAERRIYQSWPPGAFIPIYVVAKLLGWPPSVPMINWINVISHGVLALSLSLAAFSIARFNRLSLFASTGIAMATICPVLMPRGMVYTFSQLYCFTTHSLPYMALFILLEAVYFRSMTEPERRLAFAAQMALAFWSFFIDWLAFTVFAVWIVLRWFGARRRLIAPLGRVQAALAVSLPLVAFGLYLIWRLATPGSMARTQGVGTSLYELGWKVVFRMGFSKDRPLDSHFPALFIHLHREYFSALAFPLIVGSLVLASILLGIAFLRGRDHETRSAVFVTGALMILSTLPFYGHLLLFAQHTSIHNYGISKVVFPFAMVPFVFAPISIVLLTRSVEWTAPRTRWWWLLTRAATALTVIILVAGSVRLGAAHDSPYLMGDVNLGKFEKWDSIRRNTGYSDVVFSPDLQEAQPMSVRVGVANKIVYPAADLSAVDARVGSICEPFNVVIVGTSPKALRPFATRAAAERFDDAGLTFRRFKDYPGRAEGCH